MYIDAHDMSIDERKARITKLVEQFEKNLAYYKSADYNEAQCRNEYIDPLLECLGWDVKNQKGATPNRREVVVEDKINVKGSDNTKHPDYSLRYGVSPVIYVEAKKPKVDLYLDPEPAYQVRRYGWNSKMPFVILTDFEEFVVYDTNIMPKAGDNAYVARIEYYKFKEYPDVIEKLYNRFSWNAVDIGEFDTYKEDSKDKKGTGTVDKHILAMIENWRESLANDIAKNNETLDEYNLTSAVQKLVDRILFLRICEDKQIENPRTLKLIADSKKDIYPQLISLFNKADQKFNSGLFQSLEWLNKLVVNDKVLCNIINELYYPLNPYEFSVIPIEILGSIYEHFLGKIITFDRKTKYGHSIKIIEKPEVKKAGGVYYTPDYIVRYIVDNTIGELIKDKTPDEISSMRFVDPACGSGSFLVGAYKFLLDYHLNWYLTNPVRMENAEKKEIIYKDAKTREYKLSAVEKKRILVNNIYGVDIDAQAVEVTKLSLFLQLLENEGYELSNNGQINIFKHSVKTRILPNLSKNIKCGNSLIGTDYYHNKNLSLFGIKEQRKINAFDWEEQFSEVFANGGFDAVIGNPPYLDANGMVDIMPDERSFISNSANYTLLNQKWDIYIAFIDIGINKLLKKFGRFSMIIPYPFVNQEYARLARQQLIRSASLISIVDCSDVKVFDDATVYNCIPVVKKSANEENIKLIRLLKSKHFELYSIQQLSSIVIDEQKFVYHLQKSEGVNIFTKRFESLKVIGDYCYISKGMVLNADEKLSKGAFKKADLIQNNKDDIHNRMYSEGKDIDSYFLKRIRFLEWGTQRCPVLISRLTFPELYERPKILTNKLGEIKATYDDCNIVCEQTIRVLVLWKDLKNVNNKSINDVIRRYSNLTRTEMEFLSETLDLKVILAILNSKYGQILLDSIRGIGNKDINPEYIRNIPIPEISNNNQNLLVQLVNQMIAAKKQLYEVVSDSDKAFIQQRIDALDKQINRMVYELYGLTEEEIAVVERG